MADKDLQNLLDASGKGRTMKILRAISNGANTDYYVSVDQGPNAGRCRWITVPTANSDAQKDTAIRAALGKYR
jgi:hypothetical protein